jgi:hypothetical protein
MVIEQPQQQSAGDKALSTGYKVSGWSWRLKAIGTFIFGGILILIGLITSVITGSLIPLILVLVGLIAIFFGWIRWRRAKSLVQGRFY